MTLSDGTLQHDASFSTVDERSRDDGRTEVDFVDSDQYSLAAYKILELLGLDHMMPVTVERTYDSKSGCSAGGWIRWMKASG